MIWQQWALLAILAYGYLEGFVGYGTVNNKTYTKPRIAYALANSVVCIALIVSVSTGAAGVILLIWEALCLLFVASLIGKRRQYLTQPGELVLLTIISGILGLLICLL